MPVPPVQFIDSPPGAGRSCDDDSRPRRLAVLQQPANAANAPKNADQSPSQQHLSRRPGIFWLQGFKSNMISQKATALAEWTKRKGLAFTRFDYSGHGQSEGRFEDGTIGAWLEDATTVFNEITRGPQIVVGSSMGGWLALLLLRNALAGRPGDAAAPAPEPEPERIKGLVLIAPAWDMTEELMWKKAAPELRRELIDEGHVLRSSDYDDDPYLITRRLIEEGRDHLILDRPFNPGRPISIIHGQLDPDVPFDHSRRLQRLLPGGHVQITSVTDGEHRLSRPQDLELLCSTIEAMVDRGEPKVEIG